MSMPGPMNKPEEVKSLLAEISFPVGSPAMVNIDREMTPILAELLTLGPADGNNSTIKQLFNWLVDPQRTVQEFNYVIGPLGQHVHDIMDEHFLNYQYNKDRFCTYLGKIAAEALAKKNPILVGHWEYVAWFVVRETCAYETLKLGFSSDCLSDWVIRNMSDSDLCPNTFLRIELMHLLHNMVRINDRIRGQAFASWMSAFSSVNITCLLKMPIGEFHYMDLHNIISILCQLTSEAPYIDKNLCEKLSSLKTLRLTTEIHDFGYHRSLTPSKYAEPKEIYVLVALLKALKGEIGFHYKRFQDEHIYQDLENYLYLMSDSIYDFIDSFKLLFKNPQLFELTTSCIMDAMELVVLGNAALQIAELEDEERDYETYLYRIEHVLEVLTLTENTKSLYPLSTAFFMSPVGKAIAQKYDTRLISIRNHVKYASFEGFSILGSLFPSEYDNM